MGSIAVVVLHKDGYTAFIIYIRKEKKKKKQEKNATQHDDRLVAAIKANLKKYETN